MGFSTYLKRAIFAKVTSKEQNLNNCSFLMQGKLKNDKEMLTLFAVGIAAANVDGVMTAEEKESILTMAKSIRPTHPKVAQCVDKMLKNTSLNIENVLLDAYEFMTQKEEVDWWDFKEKLRTLIEDVVKADGIITVQEKEFIAAFEAYFLVNIDTHIDKSQ